MTGYSILNDAGEINSDIPDRETALLWASERADERDETVYVTGPDITDCITFRPTRRYLVVLENRWGGHPVSAEAHADACARMREWLTDHLGSSGQRTQSPLSIDVRPPRDFETAGIYGQQPNGHMTLLGLMDVPLDVANLVVRAWEWEVTSQTKHTC